MWILMAPQEAREAGRLAVPLLSAARVARVELLLLVVMVIELAPVAVALAW